MSYVANRQTERQTERNTDKQTLLQITSFAKEVMKDICWAETSKLCPTWSMFLAWLSSLCSCCTTVSFSCFCSVSCLFIWLVSARYCLLTASSSSLFCCNSALVCFASVLLCCSSALVRWRVLLLSWSCSLLCCNSLWRRWISCCLVAMVSCSSLTCSRNNHEINNLPPSWHTTV